MQLSSLLSGCLGQRPSSLSIASALPLASIRHARLNACLAFAVVVTSFTSIHAQDVSVTQLDGGTVAGELIGWDEKQIIVTTLDGEQRIATDSLLSIRWNSNEPAKPDATAGTGLLELTDGTILPIAEFVSHGSKADATIGGTVPNSDSAASLSLAKKQVAAVRLRPLDETLLKQWMEIRDLKLAADVLVVLKRDGQSLDYVEGVLGDVTTEKVEFELDGDAVKLDREKVAGVIYFRRDSGNGREPAFVVHGSGGFKANVASAKLTEKMMEFVTVNGTKLGWPMRDIQIADFSAGKILYLSDLEPASEKFTPLIAVPSAAEISTDYGKPRRDQSAYGGPLTLEWPEEFTDTIEANRNTFAKGLAVRSRTELVYRLPAGYRRLSTVAGIEPATRASGNVKLEIFGDDEPLATADVGGGDMPSTIEVNIDGVKRLKIVVDYGQNLDTGDWLNLCDLKILK